MQRETPDFSLSDQRQFPLTLMFENGGVKVGHGSGGIVLLRAA